MYVVIRHEAPQAHQTGTANHGSSLEPGALNDPRHSRDVPKRIRPAYTTIQTTVYRLETKKTLRRARKISHAHVFEPLISRDDAQGRLIDELLSLLGDRLQPVMAHLIDSRKLTLEHIREAERTLLARGDGQKDNE